MIHLHTLGDALITVGEKEIRPTAPLVFAALLYLALERGRRVPRTALQEIFFPDADEKSGAHSLRQLLYKLRQLGAPLQADSVSVTLAVEQVQDDAAIQLADVHTNGVEKYGRGFLPDYAPKLSQQYGEWLDRRREAVVSALRRQLIAALKASRDAMNWPDVEKYAHLVLNLDSFNEEATLALAEATALTGAKAKAIEILTNYERETGRTDLRLPPSLLKRRIADAGAPRSSSSATRFVGRDAEADALRNRILRARSGSPSFTVVAGEAGIGKTRLVEEAIALAALEGIRVHVVRCQAHYASRPLSVFIELVPSLLDAPGALGVAPESLQQLELLTRHVESRDNTTHPDLILASLRDLVDAVASEAPTALVIEDAWRADADSLRELRALANSASRRRLVVICTTRVTDPLKKAGALDDDTVVLRLRPLAQQPMQSLARELLPAFQSAEAVANWCAGAAAGNPLFLQMLCRHHRETGQSYVVPPDLRSATTHRIEQLPQDSRRVLQFGALLGRHTTLDALQSLTERTPVQLLSAIERLEEEGYLRIDGDVPRVAHDLLSECTLGRLTPIARRMLHRAVAAHLERRYDATNDAALLWDCAEQWSQSGDVAKALEFLKRCARHASAIGQHAPAQEILGRAKLIAKAPAEIAGILGEMILVAKATYNWGSVQQLWAERLLIRDLRGEAVHTPVELAAHTAAHRMGLETEAATRALLECVRAETASAEHRIDAAYQLVMIAEETCNQSLAKVAFATVEPWVQEAGASNRAAFLGMFYHLFAGDRDLSMSYARDLVANLPATESVWERFHLAYHMVGYLAMLGAPNSESLPLAMQYLEVARQRDFRIWIHQFSVIICLIHCIEEDWPEAMRWHAEAVQYEPPVYRGMASFVHIVNGLEIAVGTGDEPLARARWDSMAPFQHGPLIARAYFLALEARIAQLDPAFRCEESQLQQLLDLHDKIKRFGTADCLTVAIAESLLRRGRLDEMRAFVSDYVTNCRRERSPLPPSLARLHEWQQRTPALGSSQTPGVSVAS